MDFAGVARQVQKRLDELELPVALVGALALSVYGVARATADLDLLTVARAQDELLRFLEGLGYETLHVSSGYSNHLHSDPESGRVDVLYVDPATEQKLFSQAQKHRVAANLVMTVPSPEHLVAMKVRAIKNDPRRTLQDLADIQSLLRSTAVDRSEVESYFEELGLGDLYGQIEETL